ncbi:MAG: hypothetical protein AB1325_13800, partial [Nitrospirota bacterium]
YFFPYGNHTDFLAPLKALSPLFEAMLYRFKSIGLPTLFHDEPELKPLTEENILSLLNNAIQDKERGLGNLNISADEDALKHIAK